MYTANIPTLKPSVAAGPNPPMASNSSSSKNNNNMLSSGKDTAMMTTMTTTTVAPPANDNTATATAAKVKPCCVCKDEKAARDECMLFTQSDDPQRACRDLVGRYKDCMAGFGFQI